MSSRSAYFHVTVLSNFARGFDKYSRSYSKSRIPESTFPDRFFVLRRDELSIGVAKAERLLDKLGLPGNRLVALETELNDDDLELNLRTGLGLFVASPSIQLRDLHDVVRSPDGWRLSPLVTEEAVAQSLRLLHTELIPFERLQPRTLSVLPIAKGCQASCPFCFSDASVSASQGQGKLDFERVTSFARAARGRGASRFVITGGGEPGLVPHEKLLRLIASGASQLGKSVLITNGHHLGALDETKRQAALHDYHAAGLGVLAVSRHHHDDEVNASLMSLATPASGIASTWLAGRERWPNLRFRLTCVLQQGGVCDAAGVAAYVAWAAGLGVEEICFKELYVSTSVESVYHRHAANEWSHAHQVPLSLVLDFARTHGFEEVSRLPWGAPVFRGSFRGRMLRLAAYTEPSLLWERTHGVARSWNLMADGRCLASLEDRESDVALENAG